jgi:branched-chain amino acid transport system substrate-binding protein
LGVLSLPSIMKPAVHRRTALATASLVLAPAFVRAQGTGVSSDTIRIGQTAALTGNLSFANLAANMAAKAYLSEVNAKGGVGGKKIELVSIDDMYDAARAGANAKQLLSENGGVLAMWGVGGTPANLAIQPALEEARVPSIAPFSGFDGLRKPEFKHLFHIRASYAQELAKMAEYCKTSGLNNIAVLYSDNAFGKGGLAMFEAAAKKSGVTLKGAVVMADKLESESALTTQIKALGANAVLGITSAVAGLSWAKNEIPKLGVPYLTISLLANEVTVKAMGRASMGIIVAQTVPYPQNGKYPVSKELQGVMTRTKVAPPESLGFAAMEGYIGMRVLVEALQRAGRNITRDGLVNALGSRQFDLKGYTVDFTGGKRAGSSFVELSQVTAEGRFVQ